MRTDIGTVGLGMGRYLFIGNFSSRFRGTLSPSEQIVGLLRRDGMCVYAASTAANVAVRIVEIILKTAFCRFDVAHVDVFSGRAFRIAELAVLLCKWRSKKIILNLHGGRLAEFHASYPTKVERVLRAADNVVSPSKMLSDYFEGCGIKVRYHPNFIMLDRFVYGRDNDGSCSILWVRAFSSIYNPMLAVQILQEVRKTVPAATLTMVGPDSGELRQVQSLVRTLNLDGAVVITGPVPNEQLPSVYRSHNIYLNTAAFESFGVAILEAAACGIPVVSARVGEVPYLWQDGVEILTVAECDPRAFAAQIVRLYSDKELAQNLSANARRKAEGFDWSMAKPRWRDLLGETDAA